MIQRFLRANIPPSDTYKLKPCQYMLIYNEKYKKAERYSSSSALTKMVRINDGDRIEARTGNHLFPQPVDEEAGRIISLLRKLKPISSRLPPSVMIAEVLTPDEPHGSIGIFDKTIADEIVGLLKNNAFKVFIKQGPERDANILGCSFSLQSNTRGQTRKSATSHNFIWTVRMLFYSSFLVS